MGFDLGRLLRDVAGTAQQNTEGGLRMAGEFLMELPGAVGGYVQEIPQKGSCRSCRQLSARTPALLLGI